MRNNLNKWIGALVMLIGAALLVLGLMRCSTNPEGTQPLQALPIQSDPVLEATELDLDESVDQELQIRALEQAQRDRATREQQAQIAAFQDQQLDGLVDITLEEQAQPEQNVAQNTNETGLSPSELPDPSLDSASQADEELEAVVSEEPDESSQAPSDDQKLEAAVKQLAQARSNPAEGGSRVYSVQVGLAPTLSQAQELQARLKAKGYAVALSNTDSGVRVLVGPEKNKASALALKDVINLDSSLKVKGAWVNRVNKGLFGTKQSASTKPAAPLKAESKTTGSNTAAKLPEPTDTQATTPQPSANNVISKSKPLNNYRVQVALAVDQSRADDLIAKLSMSGFEASSAPEGPGVRVTVGGNYTQSQAASVQRQINENPELGISGAWIRAD